MSSDTEDRLVDQQLVITTELFINNYMITGHSLICQLLELYHHTIIVKIKAHKCDFLYQVKILCKYQTIFLL